MSAKIVAGNWKMNLGPEGARGFIEALELPGSPDEGRVLLFPPAISFAAVREALAAREGMAVGLGVQNVHHEDAGAFTGETSVPMAREAGASHVLVGHSERRHVFGESDGEAAAKVEAVLRHDLTPVLCVGETLEQRRADRVREVILGQLDAVLDHRAIRDPLAEGAGRFLVAYEPVWAIGTGETATPGDASEAHAILRSRLAEILGDEEGSRIPILYGGSVKPGNAADLMAAPGVDGVLVGGASLEPDSFARIVDAAG